MYSIRKWFHQFWQPPHKIWQQSSAQITVTITLRQPFWMALALALLILYGFLQQKIVVIALFTVGGILCSSWFWARQMSRRLHAQRKLRYAAHQVGDELEENITLWNDSILPGLWVRVDDQGDFPHYSIGSIRWVGGQGMSEWRHRQICLQRGVFSLGPWSIITSDPMGIFSVQREYHHGQQMIVYPPLANLREDMLPYGKQQGDLRQLNLPTMAESILSTHARPYIPGDALNHIHWRTTARRNSPYVKVFDPEAVSRIWLIPDLDPAVHCGSGLDSTEETLILLIAALAAQLLEQKREVGLFANANPQQIIMPQRGTAHLWNFLRVLAPLHVTQPQPFAESLAQALPLISSRDLVIVVTPSQQQSWVRKLAQLTHSRQGSEAWAYILDAQPFGGTTPPNGLAAYAASFGVQTRLIHPRDIQTRLGAFGEIRRWEFITTGTGKVVLRNSPRQAAATPGDEYA
jgi:uncharacterized protein (DUF58 family)